MHLLATAYGPQCIGALIDVNAGTIDYLPARPEFHDGTIGDDCSMRPFGISWTQERLFIANNRQLLSFDRRLEFIRVESRLLQGNVHQISLHEETLWAVSPWTNSLIGLPVEGVGPPMEFDLASSRLAPYVLRDASPEGDIVHINSLLWSDESLFIAAHNRRRPSFIAEYTTDCSRMKSIRPDVGFMIHGLAQDAGELFWISTGTHEIRSSRGRTVRLKRQQFARGFAMTTEVFVVGFSEFRPRERRFTGGSWIQIIERRNGELLQEFALQDTGDLNDLRILDEYDFAHQVEPFWPISSERNN